MENVIRFKNLANDPTIERTEKRNKYGCSTLLGLKSLTVEVSEAECVWNTNIPKDGHNKTLVTIDARKSGFADPESEIR